MVYTKYYRSCNQAVVKYLMFSRKSTYVVPPAHFVYPRVGFNIAFEVDIYAFLDDAAI